MLYSSSCALAQPLPVRPSIRPVYSPMPARQEYGYYIYIYIYNAYYYTRACSMMMMMMYYLVVSITTTGAI